MSIVPFPRSFGALAMGALVLGLACHPSPAQQAEAKDIETTILADLKAGDSLEKIETDVAAILGGPLAVDIATIVDDAIAYLLDIGAVPPTSMPHAKTIQARAHVTRK